MNIVFLCKGNICRSPAAQAYLEMLDPDLRVVSMATTNNTRGQDHDPRMMAELERREIPTTGLCFGVRVKSDYAYIDKWATHVFDLHEAGIQDPYLTGDFEGAMDEIISFIEAEVLPKIYEYKLK